MALAEEFERNGLWLFRWRSYLPLIFITMLLFQIREYEYIGHDKEQWDGFWEAICLMVSFAGLGVRIITIGQVPKKTSGRNTKSGQVAETINTTGIYSIVRHPLYVGNFLMGLGVSLFLHLWWLVLIYILMFWLYYERIMFAEEAFLRRKFGAQFEDWASRVPSFVPNFSQYERAALPFSLKNVLKREYNGLLGIIAVFFVLEILGDYVAEGKWEVDAGWAILLGAGVFAWIFLFTLRRAGWLDVPGR